ncbi:273_t:CDS:2, partial [Gigaspora rosea]
METSLLPENVKKTITQLQRQLKTANLFEDLVITPTSFKYGTNLVREELTVSATSLMSDAQKIRSNLMIYIIDLRCQELGVVLNNQAWSEHARKEVWLYFTMRKYLEVWKVSLQDFTILLKEARAIKELELEELFHSTNEFLEVTLQE